MDIYEMDAEERDAAVQVLVELCRNHYSLFQEIRMPDHLRTCVEDIVAKRASCYDPEGPRLQQEAWEYLIEALNLKHGA